MTGRQINKFAVTSDERDDDFWGFAHEAGGLFTPLQDDEGARRVHLAGCSPQGSLLKSLDHLGGRRAAVGNAWIDVLTAEGATMGSYFVADVTVVDCQVSAREAGLVDLTVTLWCDQALPGADAVWELIRTGRLDRTGLWHELGSEDRRAWLSVALWSHRYRRELKPGGDSPAGQVSSWMVGSRRVLRTMMRWNAGAPQWAPGCGQS